VRFKLELSPESLHYRGLYICAWGLDILKIDKISTDYSVLDFNLEGMLPVAMGVF